MENVRRSPYDGFSRADRGHLRIGALKSTLRREQKAMLAMSRAQFRAYLGAEGMADRVMVGVCIFRLDGRTLQPTILLLRRSPRWWRQRMLAPGRHGAGEWELPGGKVRDDDYCISAAIERLVREKTGLKVIKIMDMLQQMRWTTELKEGTCDGERGGCEGEGTEMDCRMSIERDESPETSDRGIYIASSSTSEASTPARLTPDSDSFTPPPPPPKDNYGYGYGHGYKYSEDDDKYHDPSLEPPPLFLPRRSSRRPKPYEKAMGKNDELDLPPPPVPPLRRHTTASSTALPDPGWGFAKTIPSPARRREHVQLNFTVLVDEEAAGEVVPGFMLGEEGEGGGVVYEHDALEWATCARVAGLPMSEDLRRVVFQGLNWMGRLTGDFF